MNIMIAYNQLLTSLKGTNRIFHIAIIGKVYWICAAYGSSMNHTAQP